MRPIMQVSGVNKSYLNQGMTVKALENTTFEVGKGEIIGLLGNNGAGKTTLIKIICGLLDPDSGKVFINNKCVQKDRMKALKSISAVFEGNRNLYWRLTVKENLEYFAGIRGYSYNAIKNKTDQILELFKITDKKNQLVQQLSRGMQQKVAIAVSLLANSEILLLDEPTLGLDMESNYEVRRLLKKIAENEERTILLSTHDMPVVEELCERTLVMNHGKLIVDDRVDNLMRLFESRAYKITLGSELSEVQKNEMFMKFPLSKYNIDQDVVNIEINFENGEHIYHLLDLLKTEMTPVHAIDRISVDFEAVFMKITRGEV